MANMRNSREINSLNKVIDVMATLYNKTCKIAQDEYSKHDIDVMVDNEHYGVIEVKQRNFDGYQIKKYSKDGFMLEAIKYDYLKTKRSMYINYFETNGKEGMVMWNISSIGKCEKANIMANKTTDFDNRNIVNKQSLLLKLCDASKLIINNDGWKEVNGDEFLKYFG